MSMCQLSEMLGRNIQAQQIECLSYASSEGQSPSGIWWHDECEMSIMNWRSADDLSGSPATGLTGNSAARERLVGLGQEGPQFVVLRV
jgi:hypothetical protein